MRIEMGQTQLNHSTGEQITELAHLEEKKKKERYSGFLKYLTWDKLESVCYFFWSVFAFPPSLISLWKKVHLNWDKDDDFWVQLHQSNTRQETAALHQTLASARTRFAPEASSDSARRFKLVLWSLCRLRQSPDNTICLCPITLTFLKILLIILYCQPRLLCIDWDGRSGGREAPEVSIQSLLTQQEIKYARTLYH